ncbi:MAG: lysozyme inhibitor LprI family protein [Terracidiphilus sp.]
MNPRLVVLAFFLACAAGAVAQLEDAGDATQAKCKQYLETPLPPEAAQVPAPKQWPDCNSYKLYSGIGTKIDYAAARKCAWSERLAQRADLEPKYTVGSVFGDSAVLAVMYANGDGVQRVLRLAGRLVCEAGGAPAEIGIRLEHVESLSKITTAPAPKFDFCDDITSGFMQGFCAAYESEMQDDKRTHSLKSISSRFTPPQLTAFDHLLKSQQAYARAHARGEIDLGGTARAMYQIDAEDTLQDDFIEALRSFESGKYPKGSAEDYRNADSRLNLAYRKAISDAEKHKQDYGAVQPDGIRDAERAWLKYRDAWTSFAKLRYPAVTAAAWLELLTNDRTSVLNGSFCDMDDMEGLCAQQGPAWKPSPLP